MRKIYNGKESGLEFSITPEYLSVVYQASADDRGLLVDYLAKKHPGSVNIFSSKNKIRNRKLMNSPVIASVGAIGSGMNDVKMLNKAEISFSTKIRSHEEP